MKAYILALGLLVLGGGADASEWVVYGQTSISFTSPGNNIDNPAPNTAGVTGEISLLPYTVPAGQCLTVVAFGIEGYDRTGTAVIFPWLGATYGPGNSKALYSVGADGGSNETTGFQFIIPAGTILNFHLINGQGATQTYAWFARGHLDSC